MSNLNNAQTDFGAAQEKLKAVQDKQGMEQQGVEQRARKSCSSDGPYVETGGIGATTIREPLIFRLARDARDAGIRNERTLRALQLLTQYPFFEEFLEFLRLVPHVPIN